MRDAPPALSGEEGERGEGERGTSLQPPEVPSQPQHLPASRRTIDPSSSKACGRFAAFYSKW